MKRAFSLLLSLLLLFSMTGCKRSLNSVIANEAKITGIVEDVSENAILILCQDLQGYSDDVLCWVSLDVEYPDGITQFSVGDEVAVYFDGMIAESSPLQISGVYAVLLLTPSDRSVNEHS